MNNYIYSIDYYHQTQLRSNLDNFGILVVSKPWVKSVILGGSIFIKILSNSFAGDLVS